MKKAVLIILVGALLPWLNEYRLCFELMSTGLFHACCGIFKTKISPYQSWNDNKEKLSKIPVYSDEDKKLVHFLEQRWLAKGNGFYPSMINWVYPLFGYSLQVHPDTTGCYSRNPSEKLSRTYRKRLEAFGGDSIILTRPYDVSEYLPEQVKRVQGGVGVPKEKYDSLLQYIGSFGLSATRVELDRWPSPPIETRDVPPLPWRSPPICYGKEQKLLDGLLLSVSKEKWEEVKKSPTKSSIVSLSFSQLEQSTTLDEQHSALLALLEVFSPFKKSDFSSIYQRAMPSLPKSLLVHMKGGVHAAGMTTLAGLFKVLDRPHVFCGENSYFECVDVAQGYAHLESDPANVDLIIAQHNPVLNRGDVEYYREEDVAKNVRKALLAKEEVTVALDATFDYIDSKKVASFLCEFEKEILSGRLNVVCFRSGIKFDMFGMDNYCGAPFFLINNGDPKWDRFDILLDDPVLQTDHLSLNWFCLAYSFVVDDLEEYRKAFFLNARALLDRVPEKLLGKGQYRVIPIHGDAEASFVDIRVSGPFHKIRTSVLVCGTLLIKSLVHGHPTFTRASIGFAHPNFSIIFNESCSIVRFSPGVNHDEVEFFAQCLETIALL